MLNDAHLRSIRPTDRPQKFSDSGGLHLLVKPNGGKYWRYSYRVNGKQKTLALGVYPDVRLAEARDRHMEARRQLGRGIDPSAKKLASELTFEVIARQWYAHWATDRNARHAGYVLKRLEADVFPEIGSQPVSEIPTSAFRDAVKKIEARGALDIAKRVLQTCGQIMRYAVANDLAARNPVVDVKPADVLKTYKRRNYPRVDAKDLPDLLRAIDAYVGGEHTRLALQLMALTFVRTSELIGARWAEFDLEADRWNIPAERTQANVIILATIRRN